MVAAWRSCSTWPLIKTMASNPWLQGIEAIGLSLDPPTFEVLSASERENALTY